MPPEKLNSKQALLAKIQKDIKLHYRERYEQIYDSVKVKDVMLEWMSVRQEYHQTQNLPDSHDNFFMPLILGKVMGHSEIRNGRHWKISNECYMCDKWKYSYVFWDLKNTGTKFQIKDPLLESMLDEMILSHERYQELLKGGQITSRRGRAYICGTFTNWEPRRMLQIDELCACIQKKEDVLLNEDRRAFYSNQIKTRWRHILESSTQYANDGTQKIDMPPSYEYGKSSPPDIDFNQLFVYADFIKPGKHQYVVTFENQIVQKEPEREQASAGAGGGRIAAKRLEEEEPEPFVPIVSTIKLTSYHQFLGQAHLDKYNVNTKVNEFDSIDRAFEKDKSIFKDWRLDKPKAVCDGFLEEIAYWKVPNFVKDEEECEAIEKYMQSQALFLKTLFTVRAAASHFPVIRWLNYAPLVTEWNLADADFEMATVDRIFIAVTKNMDKALHGILPEKDMSRFQFYESLVRIAFFKYKQTGLTSTTLDGVKTLIEKVLKPKYDNWVWHGWRTEQLWTLDIDDLFKANKSAMTKLYKYYFVAKKTKAYTMEDATEMFTKEVEIDMLPEQICHCWGLSQMTVNNDIKKRHLYFEATFVEFVEFFSRLAAAKFKEGPHKNTKLIEKIEAMMDISFPIVNAKRKEVQIEVEYVSCSEDELDEDKYFI